MDGVLTGKWEYDIIKMSRVEGKIDSGVEGAKTGSIFQQYRTVLKMCRNQFIILALYIMHCFRHIFGR